MWVKMFEIYPDISEISAEVNDIFKSDDDN